MNDDGVIESIRMATIRDNMAQEALRDAKRRAVNARESLIITLVEHKADGCLTVNRAALMQLLRS